MLPQQTDKINISMIEYFDSHCHIDEARFDEDRDALHQRMAEAGITRYAVIGTDLPSSRHAMAYAAAHPGAVCAVGYHPSDCAPYREDDLDTLAEMTKDPLVRAIGEIGLDYHWEDNPPRDWQQKVCEDQIELAWRLGLPAAFHVRDAHADMLELIKRHRTHLSGGIMHCFSGSWELAEEYLKLGYCISFAGPVTFKNARKLQEVAVKTPLDRILIETDSPYMAPEPMRGKRNEPTFVRYVGARIAELRGLTLEEVAEATTANARRVYGV